MRSFAHCQLQLLVSPPPHLEREVFQSRPLACPERRSSLLNLAKEFRVVLKPILEPVLLGLEPDQNAGRSSVFCDHDFLIGRQFQVT